MTTESCSPFEEAVAVASPDIHQKRHVVVLQEGPLGVERDERAIKQKTRDIRGLDGFACGESAGVKAIAKLKACFSNSCQF